ncbi:hypothetical protein [Asticcacaulis sp. 201]|uniref:hypothetical protein n=1 Tax=Asticcacaulis sp. 201 TaxID=3028787 RepID=UPI0029165AC0|nr:hypothetical protein [Asticcacaulis sp. 201]MDV6330601.1 hypothetical protein [Asticcacaulis sp. 201]
MQQNSTQRSAFDLNGVTPRRQRSLQLGSAKSLAVFVAAIGVCGGALADEIHAPPPPAPTAVVDANNVNLISGSPVTRQPSLSTAGLSDTMGNTGHTWKGMVTDYNDSFAGYIADINHNVANPSQTGNLPIVIGGKGFQLGVDIFAGNCTGAICTYWDKDGVAYLFDTTKKSDGYDGIAVKIGVLVQINKPDGETIKINLIASSKSFAVSGGTNNQQYTVYSLYLYYPSTVISSNGWMAKYEYTTQTEPLTGTVGSYIAYAPNKIYLINTAIDYCDPAATTCTSVNSTRWPTWNISNRTVFKDGSNNPIGQFSPDSYTLPSGVSYSYPVAWHTHRVTDANVQGRHTAYSYSWPDGQVGSAPYIITATKPDGASYSIRSEKFNYMFFGSATDFTYFYLDQPSSFTNELGAVTRYEYFADNTADKADNRSLKRVISPEATYSGSTLTGGYTEYGYDGRRNVTSVSVYPKGGGTPQVTSYEYEASCSSATYIYCNKVKKITDPRGNVTTLTYSTVHGQVLTETGAADASGVRIQKRYTYTQLYPKVLNSSLTLVNSTPAWRLTKVSTCRSATSADPASCVGTAQETVTEYEYNTNNLLLSKTTVRAGNANVSQPYSETNSWQSSSFTYDLVGNQVSVDGPRTDVDDRTYTTYDVRRRKIFEIGADPDGSGPMTRQVVRHWYDDDDREYRTEVGTGNATDGSDFVVSSFTRMSYDSTSGLLVKTEVGQP